MCVDMSLLKGCYDIYDPAWRDDAAVRDGLDPADFATPEQFACALLVAALEGSASA